MAVNRQLRDELLAFVFDYLHHQVDDETLQSFPESFWEKLESSQKETGAEDRGLSHVACHMLAPDYDVWYGYQWTPAKYERYRRWVAFLRSDIELPRYTYVDVRHYGRLGLLFMYTVIAVVITLLCISAAGVYGLIVWLFFSLPVFIGRHYSRSFLKPTEEEIFSPFVSEAQFLAHKHLADERPGMPAYEELVRMEPARKWREKLWGRVVVLPLTFALLGIFYSIYLCAAWPLALYENWARTTERRIHDEAN